jgi:hypothetical protein
VELLPPPPSSPPAMSFFAEVLPAFADAASAGEFKKFLAAMQQFLPFFDRMGSMFKVVKSDIGGNVDKLLAGTAKCAANATFASVIDADVAEGKTAKTGGSNAESLLWLKRAMEFIMLLLSKVSETKDEVKKCAQESYEVSLGKHHNFIVRKTTSVMMGTAPGRADLMAALGPRFVCDIQFHLITRAPFWLLACAGSLFLTQPLQRSCCHRRHEKMDCCCESNDSGVC